MTTLQTCPNDEKKAKAELKDQANTKLKAQEDIVKGLVTGIGQTNQTMAPVKFKPQAADPKDWIVLYAGYNSVVDNGTTIGSGFSRRDTSKTTHPEVVGGKREHDTWSQTDTADNLTITRSGMEAPSSAERPFQKQKPADWKCYQHFPVRETPGFSI
ncbi:MAG: hypothetical protein ACI9MC_001970 [Kiritimatiellia bacterium]